MLGKGVLCKNKKLIKLSMNRGCRVECGFYGHNLRSDIIEGGPTNGVLMHLEFPVMVFWSLENKYT